MYVVGKWINLSFCVIKHVWLKLLWFTDSFLLCSASWSEYPFEVDKSIWILWTTIRRTLGKWCNCSTVDLIKSGMCFFISSIICLMQWQVEKIVSFVPVLTWFLLDFSRLLPITNKFCRLCHNRDIKTKIIVPNPLTVVNLGYWLERMLASGIDGIFAKWFMTWQFTTRHV